MSNNTISQSGSYERISDLEIPAIVRTSATDTNLGVEIQSNYRNDHSLLFTVILLVVFSCGFVYTYSINLSLNQMSGNVDKLLVTVNHLQYIIDQNQLTLFNLENETETNFEKIYDDIININNTVNNLQKSTEANNIALNFEHKRISELIDYWGNMTSNEDVLDEIDTLRIEMKQSLDYTEAVVDTKLDVISHNVSNQLLSSSNALTSTVSTVNSKLSTTQRQLTTQMKDIQYNISNSLSQTEKAVSSHLTIINSHLHSTENNITQKLQSNIKEVNNMLSVVDNKLQTTITDINARLTATRTNITDQLKQTKFSINKDLLVAKTDISNQMLKLKSDVSSNLQGIKSNVTVQLHSASIEMHSQSTSMISEVDNKLTTVDGRLQNTVIYVQDQLDNTIRELNSAVATTVNHIRVIQENVTDQLTMMSMSLDDAVSQLHTTVDLAKAMIHDEVVQVKENMDQYIVVTNHQFAVENDFVKYQLAGTFTLIGCLISLWHQTSHARHFTNPDVQSRVLAILCMVPIYGVTSWLALVLPTMERGFGAVRDCYEAYAVYTFFAFLIAVLADGGGMVKAIDKLKKRVEEERAHDKKQKPPSPTAISTPGVPPPLSNPNASDAPRRHKSHLRPPLPCCYNRRSPKRVASMIIWQCNMMVMQFVLLKPLLAFLPFILEFSGIDYRGTPVLLHHESINLYCPRLYVVIIQNLSVASAFYGLLNFYHSTEQDLAWCDPWPKFLCIKGVVFMTFWQGVAMQAMSSMRLVDEKSAMQIQNLLICIEMLIASLAHFYIFPYQEWGLNYKREKEKKSNNTFSDPLAFRYFASDIGVLMKRSSKLRNDSIIDDNSDTMMPLPYRVDVGGAEDCIKKNKEIDEEDNHTATNDNRQYANYEWKEEVDEEKGQDQSQSLLLLDTIYSNDNYYPSTEQEEEEEEEEEDVEQEELDCTQDLVIPQNGNEEEQVHLETETEIEGGHTNNTEMLLLASSTSNNNNSSQLIEEEEEEEVAAPTTDTATVTNPMVESLYDNNDKNNTIIELKTETETRIENETANDSSLSHTPQTTGTTTTDSILSKTDTPTNAVIIDQDVNAATDMKDLENDYQPSSCIISSTTSLSTGSNLL